MVRSRSGVAVLGVKQSKVSKIERRTDMYLSTIASFVKAMGGTLELRAVFPKGEIIKINRVTRRTGNNRRRR